MGKTMEYRLARAKMQAICKELVKAIESNPSFLGVKINRIVVKSQGPIVGEANYNLKLNTPYMLTYRFIVKKSKVKGFNQDFFWLKIHLGFNTPVPKGRELMLSPETVLTFAKGAITTHPENYYSHAEKEIGHEYGTKLMDAIAQAGREIAAAFDISVT